MCSKLILKTSPEIERMLAIACSGRKKENMKNIKKWKNIIQRLGFYNAQKFLQQHNGCVT